MLCPRGKSQLKGEVTCASALCMAEVYCFSCHHHHPLTHFLSCSRRCKAPVQVYLQQPREAGTGSGPVGAAACVALLMPRVEGQTWVRQMPGSGHHQGGFCSSLPGPASSRTESPPTVLPSTGRHRLLQVPTFLNRLSQARALCQSFSVALNERRPEGTKRREAAGGAVFIKTDQLVCAASHTDELWGRLSPWSVSVKRSNYFFFFAGKKAVSSMCSLTNIIAFAPWSQQ